MTITATIIADSICPDGHRITTMELRYPRMIHAEFMTHRVFSRNASSSRAIPIERMIQDVIDDCAMPVAWGSNQKGMQAGEAISYPVNYTDNLGNERSGHPKMVWFAARDRAVEIARGFAAAGYHKQIANRLLEPFGHISVVVTATEWDNFFDLRCHPDADPTMRALAEAIRDAIGGSVPFEPIGAWHLPYITMGDFGQISEWLEDPEHGGHHLDFLPMISAARCARVSYLNHDGTNPDIEKDLALAAKLLESKHMSPFEHQARVTGDDGTALWGNLTGWDQFRKMIEA